MAKKLVVFLHGVGSNGQDLLGLADFWRADLPDVAFAAPNAPFPCDFGAGYQWFSLAGITEANRAERVAAAREALDATLAGIMAEQQFTPGVDQLVLVGFSQGSIMSLDLLASDRLPLKGIVAFSGRLASPQPWAAASATPTLLIHGKADPVIPWQESQVAATALTEAGFQVEAVFEEGLVHSISRDGALRAAAFIANCFKA